MKVLKPGKSTFASPVVGTFTFTFTFFYFFFETWQEHICFPRSRHFHEPWQTPPGRIEMLTTSCLRSSRPPGFAFENFLTIYIYIWPNHPPTSSPMNIKVTSISKNTHNDRDDIWGVLFQHFVPILNICILLSFIFVLYEYKYEHDSFNGRLAMLSWSDFYTSKVIIITSLQGSLNVVISVYPYR